MNQQTQFSEPSIQMNANPGNMPQIINNNNHRQPHGMSLAQDNSNADIIRRLCEFQAYHYAAHGNEEI